MILKTYNIDVPITPGVMPPVIHIGQYVSACQYICHLKNDDGTDYTIPANTTATFTGCNPRKEVFELEATVDTGANTISIVPKDEATSMFGKYGATLNLFNGDNRLTPIVILMDVQKAGATDEEIAGAANFPDAVTEAVNDWLEDNIDAGQLGDIYVPRSQQAEKSADMTQPVGIDGNGKLWTTPGEGGGGSTEGAVLYNQSQNLTSGQKSQARTNIGAGTYSKPSGGIPASDMAQAVQTALTAAGTAVQPSALAAYITKAAQGNADNYSSALVVAPAGVDSNGAIKSPVAVYGTVTRSGPAGNYTYSANINAIVLYPIQQAYPHMRAFLVDHLGRECTLIKPPASDQDNLVFYTLDKANKKIVYYTVATSGATTVAEDAYNGGGGGNTPTWQDILPEGGIPQTDLAKETVTITAVSGTPVTYTSSKTFSEISTANTAGKLIVPVFKGFEGRCIDVGQNAATFEVIDATSPSAPVQYIFVVSGTGCAGAASNWGSGGGGGISKTVVTIASGSSDTSPADIYSAYQSGNVIECVAEGVSGWLAYPPSSTEAVFLVIDTDSGRRLYLYTVASDSSVTSLDWNVGTADVPVTVILSGTTPTISVGADNTIYKGGELTSLTVSAIPLNGMFTLIFDSGSTATNLILPEYDSQNPTARYVDWGDFTVEASKHYEISINCVGGVGYLVGKGW